MVTKSPPSPDSLPLPGEAVPFAKPSSAKRGLDVLSTSQTGRFDPCAPQGDTAFALRSEGIPFRARREGRNFAALRARALNECGSVALSHEGRPIRVRWNLTGKGKYACIAPRHLEVEGRRARRTETFDTHDPYMGVVEMHVRCRHCEPCLKARAAYWKLRAIAEIERATRTWFVTLTFAPDERVRAMYAAGQRLSRRGVDEPSPSEHTSALLDEANRYATLWLQRVRKGVRQAGETPAAFRYLMVAETHQDGFPHFHLLVHEGAQPLTKRRLQREWLAGFSQVKLVGSEEGDAHQAAAYVCKYITKTALGRIRPSRSYGAKSN